MCSACGYIIYIYIYIYHVYVYVCHIIYCVMYGHVCTQSCLRNLSVHVFFCIHDKLGFRRWCYPLTLVIMGRVSLGTCLKDSPHLDKINNSWTILPCDNYTRWEKKRKLNKTQHNLTKRIALNPKSSKPRGAFSGLTRWRHHWGQRKSGTVDWYPWDPLSFPPVPSWTPFSHCEWGLGPSTGSRSTATLKASTS